MGTKHEAMKAAAKKGETSPIAVPSVRVPEKASLPPKKVVIAPTVAAKPKEKRGCCGTDRGQSVPHADDCPSKKPREPKKAKLRGTRLPNGSKFSMVYTATGENDGHWDGTLTIPRDGKDDLVLQNRGGGLFGVCTRLDDFYRKSLETKS